MKEKFLSPVEVAEMLNLKKNTVYEMIKRGDLRASKMGKQFRIAQSDVYEYLGVKTDTKAPMDLVICGQDMLLDILVALFNKDHPKDFRAHRSPNGSYNGLYEMYLHDNYVATGHLWDGKTDTYNLPYAERMIPGEKVAVFHIVKRWIGFYVQKGNPLNIQSFEDLTKKDVIFINRDRGSGIRIYIDEMCKKLGIKPWQINGYKDEAASHVIAASMVQRDSANVAIGNQKVAGQFPDLDFIPLKEESYDLFIRENDLERKAYQRIVELLQSEEFVKEANAIEGYNTEGIGERLM